MTPRTEQEMTEIIDKIDEMIGPLDMWSDQALERLNDWLMDVTEIVSHEWVERDSDSEMDA